MLNRQEGRHRNLFLRRDQGNFSGSCKSVCARVQPSALTPSPFPDQVVLAYGAESDKKLGIPGEVRHRRASPEGVSFSSAQTHTTSNGCQKLPL